MTNIRSLALLACIAGYSLNTQAMLSRTLLTGIQSRQTLTRLATARSFSQSAITYNQQHDQSHQTIQPNGKYTALLKYAGTLALGAAGYIGYDQYKKYELTQLCRKYNTQDIDDALALAEAHSLLPWLTFDSKLFAFKSLTILKAGPQEFDHALDKIEYLLSHNKIARTYLIDQAAANIANLNYRVNYVLRQKPETHLPLLSAAVKKFYRLISLQTPALYFKNINSLKLTADQWGNDFVSHNLRNNNDYITTLKNLDDDVFCYLTNSNKDFLALIKKAVDERAFNSTYFIPKLESHYNRTFIQELLGKKLLEDYDRYVSSLGSVIIDPS